MKQIKLNGLLWDAENLEIDGKTYFTFDEAQEAAKSVGKRLPTVQEFEELASIWTRWDNKRKGRLFRDDENELFFPASGFRYSASGALSSVGSYGFYWSATPSSTANARYLHFSSGAVNPQNTNYRAYGFAVRCVQDIE